MSPELKLTAEKVRQNDALHLIVTAVVAVVIFITALTFISSYQDRVSKDAAYAECLKTQERISEVPGERFLSVPSCYWGR